MSAGSCKTICLRTCLRVIDKDRSYRTGQVRRIAHWRQGEKKCRTCNCVFTKEQNLSNCPCCSNKLATHPRHGVNKKRFTVARN